MESVDELRRSIKNKDQELIKQKKELKESEHDGDAIRTKLKAVKERMSGHHIRVEELIEEKIELEEALKLKTVEVDILKESARKERAHFIALREKEAYEYRKRLESVKRELKKERQKIPPLKEEIEQLLVKLAKQSVENRHLRNACEETNSQLTVERERVEMKTNELKARAVSHAKHMQEVQVSVAH